MSTAVNAVAIPQRRGTARVLLVQPRIRTIPSRPTSCVLGLSDTVDPLLCRLAQALNPFTMGNNVVRIAHEFMGDRA